VVICVGGSASTDGGVGLLCGLGGRVLDRDGQDVRPGGRWLSSIDSIDLSGLDPRLAEVDLRIATDVTSPLLGPQGAARMFAPQKGASPADVELLEAGLRSWSEVVARHTGHDLGSSAGAGAAGGTGFAALALFNAAVVSGAEFIADAIGLDSALASAQLLVTGEGALDVQSLLGKGAVHATRLAQAHGVPTAMICGRLDVATTTLSDLGVSSSGSLIDIATPDEAMENAAALLARRTVEVLAAVSRELG
jgi:glycerate kinase